MNFSKQHSGMR